MTIISHKHKLIFLKTRKTAGSSIEASLIRYCGTHDIISSAKDVMEYDIYNRYMNDIRKFNELSLHDWFYYLGSSSLLILKSLKKRNLPDRRILLPRYTQHMTASHVRRAVGEEIWRSYFKVCFERNPYDRLVSFYYWRRKRLKQDCSFEELARAVLTGNKKQQRRLAARHFSNRPFYLDNDEVVIDFVGQYENLNSDLAYISEKCGIDFDGWLPMAKSTTRKTKGYREMYTPELRGLAEEAFTVERELFGYEF